MAEKRRKALWRSPRLYMGCIAVGLVLGASCPLWPEGARPFCTTLSGDLKSIGFGWFGLMSPGASSGPKDGGT